MVVGHLPFMENTREELTKKIVVGKYSYPPAIEKHLSLECKDLIKRILNIDPSKRLTMTGIQEHPWLTGEKLQILEEDEDEETKDNVKDSTGKKADTIKKGMSVNNMAKSPPIGSAAARRESMKVADASRSSKSSNNLLPKPADRTPAGMKSPSNKVNSGSPSQFTAAVKKVNKQSCML
eukprot:TRINITY_DN5465_c0_g1_i5.p1 TRINITY_DN5465_c0_g1~~TRINITY_DN5465_c0_g1_i5.p1  ORF type:complete len:179 (-),score=33.99 TRINITY_DN5465_c0_g1_i5:175-711(-)